MDWQEFSYSKVSRFIVVVKNLDFRLFFILFVIMFQDGEGKVD